MCQIKAWPLPRVVLLARTTPKNRCIPEVPSPIDFIQTANLSAPADRVIDTVCREMYYHFRRLQAIKNGGTGFFNILLKFHRKC